MAPSMKSMLRRMVANTHYFANPSLRNLKGRVLLLNYHRVLSDSELNSSIVQPGMYVHSDVFEKQVQFLASNFQILSFSDLLNRWRGEPLDPDHRYCVITFDDGWRDNYFNAYPVLNRYSIPATIFLATDFVGTDRWFWPEMVSHVLDEDVTKIEKALSEVSGSGDGSSDLVTAVRSVLKAFRNSQRRDILDAVIERLKEFSEPAILDVANELSKLLEKPIPKNPLMLTWEEVSKMSEKGISFGSHSCSHKILTGLSRQEAIHEIRESRETLIRKTVNMVDIFCYPNGNYNAQTLSWVKEAGYQAAVSTEFGTEGLVPNDLFALKRLSIHHDMTETVPLFSWHLSGYERDLIQRDRKGR